MKDKLTDLITVAPALRSAGVRRVEYSAEGWSVEFYAPEPDTSPDDPSRGEARTPPSDDPLDDPWTYGEGGGYVPRLHRPDDEDETE